MSAASTVDAGRALSAALLAALAGLAGGALVLLAVVAEPTDAGVAALVAVTFLVPVRVPWGGSVPVGSAPVIATAALLPHSEASATLGVGLLVGAVIALARSGRPALGAVERYAASVAAAVGAVVAVDVVVDGDLGVLAAALWAAAGLLAADLAVARFAPRSDPRLDLRAALPVHLTLACAGILVAIAIDAVGVAMALVAAFPLLITRFSFDRYAGATDTLDQTVQALGLVPELAGQVPLGHSERSASYARALADALGLDRATTTRVVTATRLHHLGSVPYDHDDAPSEEPIDTASQGARIIREAGLSEAVADLLESADADVLDATAPSLEAAIVRVAATFDEIVGDDIAATDRGLALVSSAARDRYTRRVAAALLELAAAGDELVRDTVAAGDRFRDAAIGLDLEAITASRSGAGELLPLARRG